MKNSYTKDFMSISEDMNKAFEKISSDFSKNPEDATYLFNEINQSYTNWIQSVTSNSDEMSKIQNRLSQYFTDQFKLWNVILNGENEKSIGDEKSIKAKDKRFASSEWNKNPYYEFIHQNYLLFSKTVNDVVENSEVDITTKKKLRFYSKQFIDSVSPSNFLVTNPDAQKKAIETNGESLLKGFSNLLKDVQKGYVSQVDENSFILGEHIAATKGDVIFENNLIQLIQYTPTTESVYKVPLLILPPWINKYYILDLKPENSLAKFLVDKGFSVFMISWKNPKKEDGEITFDDYVEKGAIAAIDVIKSIKKSRINVMGYCLGGTLLSITQSILEKRNNTDINTTSFLAAMVDFSDVGPVGDIIDENLIKKLQNDIAKNGVMKGDVMANAFNQLRANDLIWNYTVNNYLKGEQPNNFDVIYWTNDNTNLPGNMYLYYLQNMVYANKLSRKNALKICNTPIDIGNIKTDSCVIALTEDHIAPPETVFTTTELLSGNVEFILGGSGHVMGVVNHPSKKKYGYHINGTLGNGLEEWKKTAQHIEGSWWTYWSNWLIEHSGTLVNAVLKNGNKEYPSIEKAPGKFVYEKIEK